MSRDDFKLGAWALMLHFGSGFVLSQTLRHGDFLGFRPSTGDIGYAIAAGFALMSVTCAFVVFQERLSRSRVVERHNRDENRKSGGVVFGDDANA